MSWAYWARRPSLLAAFALVAGKNLERRDTTSPAERGEPRVALAYRAPVRIGWADRDMASIQASASGGRTNAQLRFTARGMWQPLQPSKVAHPRSPRSFAECKYLLEREAYAIRHGRVKMTVNAATGRRTLQPACLLFKISSVHTGPPDDFFLHKKNFSPRPPNVSGCLLLKAQVPFLGGSFLDRCYIPPLDIWAQPLKRAYLVANLGNAKPRHAR